MTTTIGSKTEVASGDLATLTITLGGEPYVIAVALNWEMSWGYETVEYLPGGTLTPYVFTEKFVGEFNFEFLLTTDALMAIVTPNATTLQLPEVTVASAEKDTQGTPVTKTLSTTAMITNLTRAGSRGDVVKLRGRGKLLAAPTYT